MSGLSIYDSRQTPSVQVARAELAVLAERCERRRLVATRSVYLAILEASGESTPWTRAALADRAGTSTALLREVAKELERLGFVRTLVDGSWQVCSLSSDATPPPPREDKADSGVAEELRPRAERFFGVHAARVAGIRGGKPSMTIQALSAACKILAREGDSREIVARLDFALGHRFYADKVLTLTNFERWWARINAAYLADRDQQSRGPGDRPEVRPARVTYESDRVRVAR